MKRRRRSKYKGVGALTALIPAGQYDSGGRWSEGRGAFACSGAAMRLCSMRGLWAWLLSALPPAVRVAGARPHPASFITCCGRAHRIIAGRALPVELHARRKGRNGGGPKGKRSGTKKGNEQTASSLDSADITSELPSTATQRPPATLAGVIEDHRFEQFFYDDATSHQLYQLVDVYERPLLLCNPTLAVMAEKKGKRYILLDRDTRFDFLSGYEEFSLTEPHLIADYDFDAVFVDPPFANVTPDQLARCLRLMGADKVPLYAAYNSRREEKLLEALNALDCPELVPMWRLSYKEGVSDNTMESIWLYGPKDVGR